jgi:hypothetical protein
VADHDLFVVHGAGDRNRVIIVNGSVALKRLPRVKFVLGDLDCRMGAYVFDSVTQVRKSILAEGFFD